MTVTDDNITWIKNFESGKQFNAKLKSEDTRKAYLSHLKRYSDAVQKNPDELLAYKPTLFEMVMLAQQGKATAQTENQAENLLSDYILHHKNFKDEEEKDKPTVQMMGLKAIKKFYEINGKDLKESLLPEIDDIDHKQRKPVLKDIEELDGAMTNDRDKAVLWFLESCPVRVGTLRKLLWKDLVETGDAEVPYSIEVKRDRLKGKYKGARHIGFLHSYAVMKLRKYEKELEHYGIEKTSDSPLFMVLKDSVKAKKGEPLANFNVAFVDASLKAWGDLNKKRFSPHDMRDILQSIFESPEVSLNANLIKPFLSHKVGGTDGHYSSHKDEKGDLDKAEYLKAFKKVVPYLIPKTVQSVEAELKQQVQDNKQKEKQFIAMQAKIQAFEEAKPQLEMLLRKVEMLEAKLKNS